MHPADRLTQTVSSENIQDMESYRHVMPRDGIAVLRILKSRRAFRPTSTCMVHQVAGHRTRLLDIDAERHKLEEEAKSLTTSVLPDWKNIQPDEIKVRLQ